MATRITSPRRIRSAGSRKAAVKRHTTRTTQAAHLASIEKEMIAHEKRKAENEKWRFHPYRSFVEGLPAWLAILTLYMFTVVYLQSWTTALIFTLIIIVLVTLLFDVLHHLHTNLKIPEKQIAVYDGLLTRFGRGILVAFSIVFLGLFLTFSFTYQVSDTMFFMLGSVFTLIGIGLVFFFVVSYIALIIFVGFPRIRHQLSLAALLFFCYFYLFFAFAVRRVAV
ncbi:MAG: hypothetical protein WC495_06035 [Patescibacteria group bacterium]|jgi:hypothetical protein